MGMASSTFRGCTSVWESDEHEVCYEDTSLIEDSVNSAFESFFLTTSAWSGYQCFCNDKDNCNVDLNNQGQYQTMWSPSISEGVSAIKWQILPFISKGTKCKLHLHINALNNIF